MDGPESSSTEETLADCWAESEEGVLISPVPVCPPIFRRSVTVPQQFPKSRFPRAMALALPWHHPRFVVDRVGSPV